MSHVLVFGSRQLDHVLGLVKSIVSGDGDWWIGVLAPGECERLDYRESHEPLSVVGTRLLSGRLSSAQMQRSRPSEMLIGLYSPGFCGEPPQEWRCVVEGRLEEVSELYNWCKQSGGIGFVALSLDEAPEFHFDEVSLSTFPWEDWRIARAAVRGSDGRWEERAGRSAQGDPHQG